MMLTVSTVWSSMVWVCIFWGAIALIAYTYFGYPAWLWLRSRWRRADVLRGPYLPFVSIVIVVRNEEPVLRAKLENLLTLDYPAELTQLVVVSDGSTDHTDAILHEYSINPRVDVILNQLPRGKASGLNDALELSQGEVVVFTDARQTIEPGALRLLMENFADPGVGCASGALMLGNALIGESGAGVASYWRLEKGIRELESVSGSAVGATGAFYAIRRNLLESLPRETILDDVYLPMEVVRRGSRVVFDSRCRVWDSVEFATGHEFARKVRTLSGNYQLLQLAPWLLRGANPIRFEFVSHKLLRLIVPLALAALLVASLLLHAPVYRVTLALQSAFYGLSLLAMAKFRNGPVARVADAAFTFVLLNTAAVVAFANFVSGRKAAWSR